jgi:hypothetical protein
MARIFINLQDKHLQDRNVTKVFKTKNSTIFFSEKIFSEHSGNNNNHFLAGADANVVSSSDEKKCSNCIPCPSSSDVTGTSGIRPNCFICSSCSNEGGGGEEKVIVVENKCGTNDQCSDKTPYCNLGKCVQCVTREHCINGLQYCDEGVCVNKGSSQCIF